MTNMPEMTSSKGRVRTTRQRRVVITEALIQHPGGVITVNRAVVRGRLPTKLEYVIPDLPRISALMRGFHGYQLKRGEDGRDT